MCLESFIKYFFVSSFFDVIKISLLPLLILPKLTIPSISETIAGLEGFLASNISVTLGKPPVMSPEVLADLGILAIIVPALIFSFSEIITCAPTGIL